MKKIIYLLLLFTLPLSFISCGDDDDPAFVWGGDWNDSTDPNFKPDGYNPIEGLWKLGADSAGFIFTKDFKAYSVKYYPNHPNNKRVYVKTLWKEKYAINDAAFRFSLNEMWRYKLEVNKGMLILYPNLNDDNSSQVFYKIKESEWTEVEYVGNPVKE